MRQIIMKAVMRRYLTSWVKKHPYGWNHQDWLDLLSELRAKGYDVVEDDVGRYIEGKHQDFFGF